MLCPPCIAAIVTLNFTASTVTTNNLGGANTVLNASCSEDCGANEIRYVGVGSLYLNASRSVPMIITNTSFYKWRKPTMNGVLGEFGNVNVPNQPVDTVSLNFEFLLESHLYRLS